jgi:hypothetical protein|nr:MAG TPA: hypothetical protein [Caudoviricetes sp.]
MNIKVKEVVKYNGHNMAANGSVNLALKASYSELTNSIMLTQMLNNDVHIGAKLPGKKPIDLGTFRIKQISIDGDGESTLKFNSLSDFVEMDNLNQLPLASDDVKEFVVLFKANIEKEGGDE